MFWVSLGSDSSNNVVRIKRDTVVNIPDVIGIRQT